MLLTFGGRYNRYFWGTRMKILRLLNLYMLFHLVLTKFFKSELFSCLLKVKYYVIKSCKEPIQNANHFFVLKLSVFFLKSQTFLWLIRRSNAICSNNCLSQSKELWVFKQPEKTVAAWWDEMRALTPVFIRSAGAVWEGSTDDTTDRRGSWTPWLDEWN